MTIFNYVGRYLPTNKVPVSHQVGGGKDRWVRMFVTFKFTEHSVNIKKDNSLYCEHITQGDHVMRN